MTEQTAHHGRRIVVGVDGSPNSKTALGWAMTQARLTGAGIEAVAAWQEPLMTGYSYGWSPTMYDGDSIATTTEKVLAETVADLAGEHNHPVEIETRVVQGHPAQVLIEAADGAQLLGALIRRPPRHGYGRRAWRRTDSRPPGPAVRASCRRLAATSRRRCWWSR
jgi:hypothetical protein